MAKRIPKRKRKADRVKRYGEHKARVIRKGGFTFQADISKADAKHSVRIVQGFSAGTEKEIAKKIAKRRNNFVDNISGKGGLTVKKARPPFLVGEKITPRKRALYDPFRRGVKNETYYFYPVFEWSIAKTYNRDNAEAEREEFEFDDDNRLRDSDPLMLYFAAARIGSRAQWGVKPPIGQRTSEDYVIRQSLGSFRKNGLNKRKLRRLINEAEKRMQGYAIITGIRGVWRSPFSEQHANREARRLAEELRAKESKPRKPKRSRRI